MKDIIKKLIRNIREWRCNHVYLDLQKIGNEKCVFCDKEKQ